MGVRFNKRIKILPYVTMNVGKSGMSLTIGPKGKTLNIGSSGVSVNVSMGQRVGYSKRLITRKKLNLLSWLGLGGAAAATKVAKSKKGKSKASNKKETAPQGELSLDDAIAETEQAQQAEAANEAQEQQGCSWGCLLGALAIIVILALAAAVVYLYMTRA